MNKDVRVPVAIIGSGNIGTDLMIKGMRYSKHLSMGAMVGIDPAQSSPSDQDAMALALYAERGWSPWPACGIGL